MAKASLSLEEIKQIMRSHIYANEYEHIRLRWHPEKPGSVQIIFVKEMWANKKWIFARRHDSIKTAHKELWDSLRSQNCVFSFKLLSSKEFSEEAFKGLKVFET